MAASLSNADRRGTATVDSASHATGAAETVAPPLVPSEGEWWREPAIGAPPDDVWVRALYDDWVARLGEARMRGFLQRLADQLRVLSGEIERSGYNSNVDRLAHDVASTAGMMGFTEVTRRCRSLRGKPPERDDLAALASALEAAHTRIARHLSARTESAAA